jgi:hypothetical protein
MTALERVLRAVHQATKHTARGPLRVFLHALQEYLQDEIDAERREKEAGDG